MMTQETYERLQIDLSNLLQNMKYKNLSAREKEGYEKAVLACKSIVSNYNPNKNTRKL